MYNINTFYDNIQDLYIIPDLHGDYYKLILLLRDQYKVINDKLKWIGGKIHIIVLGDILDGGGRGTDGVEGLYNESKMIDLLIKLKKESRKQHGDVILLYGNHEYMNLFAHSFVTTKMKLSPDFLRNGVFYYVSKYNLNDFGGYEKRISTFNIGGEYCTKLANNFQYCAVVNGLLFSHMGIDEEFVKFIKFKFESSKLNLLEVVNYMIYCYLLNKNDVKQDIFDGLFITDISKKNVQFINEYINKQLHINISMQVVGHYIGRYIRSTAGIIFCDIGLSDAFKLPAAKHIQLLYVTNYAKCVRTKTEIIDVYKSNRKRIDNTIIEPLYLIKHNTKCIGIIQLSIEKK